MHRRQALAVLASAPLGRAQFRPVSIGCQTNAWKIESARLDSSFAVWRSIRDLGYHGLETSFRNLEPHLAEARRIRAELKSLGLVLFGVHIWLEKYDAATGLAPAALIQKTANLAAAVGAERLILSGVPTTLAAKSKALLDTAQLCRDLKLGLAYHNHAPEWTGPTPELPQLMKLTKGVEYLLDAGHAYRAGQDLARLVTEHHRSIGSIHLRDFRGDTQVPLGQGQVNYAAMVLALKNVRWRGWALAEEERADGSKPAESAARPARQQLRKLFGA
ncbi:MAG: sugar phosphate isomerase/epimerase [Bryobacteraceae bacterium]|nr:sugar phosphate isomerase/epimerase [Bryobacteraceae bacterium]